MSSAVSATSPCAQVVEILNRPGEHAKTASSCRYRRTEAPTSTERSRQWTSRPHSHYSSRVDEPETDVEQPDEEWFDDDVDED
jgi:hypothetical protein